MQTHSKKKIEPNQMKLELMPVQLLSSSSGCPKIPRSASLTPPCSVYSLNREKAFTPWTLLFIQCLTPSALRRRPLTCCDCDILLQAQSCSPIGSKLQDGQEEVVLLAPSAVTARANNWLKFEVGFKSRFRLLLLFFRLQNVTDSSWCKDGDEHFLWSTISTWVR